MGIFALLALLSGYKSYGVAIALAVLPVLRSMDVINDSTLQLLTTLLGGLGVATLRAGIATEAAKTTAAVL